MNTGETPLKVPDSKRLAHVQQLCDLTSPYELNRHNDELFVSAMREVCQWHQEHNPFYRRLTEQNQFAPESLKTIADCANILPVPATFFKLHETLSIPRSQVALHLTSSGTTGQKSQIFFDEWSIGSAQRMVERIFEYYGWITPERITNYLLFSHQTAADSKLGTSYTDHFLCKYAPARSVFTALRLTGDRKHEFDAFGAIAALQEYAKAGDEVPTRIFGFPAFLYFTLDRMHKLKVAPIKLSPESLVFLGGGWKGHADKAINKTDLYQMITEQLGIPDERIRDGFGSVEHCIPYIECRNHQLHVPIWSRVLIRDVHTLRPLAYGAKGFLNFVSPYITSVPAHSVLMGDLATLHDGETCSCEIETPYFVVHGRAGTSKNKSCAIAAAELLKRQA